MLAPSSVSSNTFPITKKEIVFTTEELLKHIQDCAREQFTGQLDVNIASSQLRQCSLYFSLGSLIGCASEVHPIRRWYRQLSIHCPKLTINAPTEGLDKAECWDYDSLATLVRQGKVLLGEMAAILESYSTELLFDIIQSGEELRYRSGLQLIYRQIPQDAIDLGWVTSRADQVWQHAINTWQEWQKAGLADISPNLAPTILSAEKLRQQTSPPAYRNLTTLADGTQTLRDLAVKLKQNALPLTQSILPYIRNGLIGLIEVGDLSKPIQSPEKNRGGERQTGREGDVHSILPSSSHPFTPGLRSATLTPRPPLSSSSAALIAYIDDSRIDSQTMNDILSQAGYRFINIQDSVQALVQLLENKPDLIFLDLVMPIANGYEICAQIRRVSLFESTPVIILTSNDGIVDRVRARMVGSSGFLAKPITEQKVLSVLQRYLPKSK